MGKRKLLLIGILLIAISAGVYFYTYRQTKELKLQMKVASEEYFDKYIRTIETASAYNVTLKDLKEANKNGENYKLNLLKKCDETKTKATINIDMTNGKIEKTEVKLDC